jgi:type IV pilus assembly protein PilE
MHRPLLSYARTVRAAGFTLIELMIVVAVMAILAAIAVPMYTDYVTRSRIIDGTTKLANVRTQMEKYFMDNRTYLNGAACGVQTTTIDPLNLDPSRSFDIGCQAVTQNTYTLRATGVAARGMGGFVYTIAQDNSKATLSVKSGWLASATCWVLRKDGSC